MVQTSFVAALLVAVLTISMQPVQAQDQEEASLPENNIIVTDETEREKVEALGKVIVRPSRGGKSVARFNAPVCVKVSGMPDEMSDLVKQRIEKNISELRGVDPAPKGCKPNAFLGVLNNVNDALDGLREDEPWLFQGLLGYQIDRIYAGSEAARAWHIFEEKNLDGTGLPGGERGSSGDRSIYSLVNSTERASRINQTRVDILGAVVLIETGALRDKTFRQLADYATLRILASTSDGVTMDETSVPTILALFNESSGPSEWTEFDRAFLSSLYEMPANFRDGQIIAAAVSRYSKSIDQDEE